MTIGSNGTLAMGYDCNLPSLMSGNLFTNGGTLDANFGTLEVFNGATCTKNDDSSVTIGKLNVANGTMDLETGYLTVPSGITVGTGATAGKFTWRSFYGAALSVNGSSMVIGQNGTLENNSYTELTGFLNGSMFADGHGGSIDLSNGTLSIIDLGWLYKTGAGTIRIKNILVAGGLGHYLGGHAGLR